MIRIDDSFKLYFPTGYVYKDIKNDNIDINIIVNDRDIYFIQCFTLNNIKSFLVQDEWFWATDLLIVKDLELKTISKTIMKMVQEQCFEDAFSYIGSVNDIYSEFYDDLEFVFLDNR